MPNRRLTSDELATLFAPFITEIRERLRTLSSGDEQLHWALRRKIAKELVYDERSKPMQRRALKAKKRREQKNKCAICPVELPQRGAVLDRLEAMGGYTFENTRLLCRDCDHKTQEERGFA
jgi:ribosomal protein L44E